MKRYLGIVVVIAGLLAAVVIVYLQFSQKVLDTERELSVVRIQKDYLERVGWIRSVPDEKAYREEVGTFLRWYFKQIDEHLARYGGRKEFDEYPNELAVKSGKGKDDRKDDKKALYEYERKVFDDMRAGKYAPLWSATDKGMRLDVRTAEIVNDKGTPKIRFDIAVWGAQRETRDDSNLPSPVPTASRNLKKVVTNASFDVKFRLLDGTGKLYGEMNATGDPSNRIDYPERYVWAFPPQMLLGYYSLDLLPADVAKAEITFNVTSRAASGGEAAASFLWKIDAPPEWKLKAGETWSGAQESVRPEEEIDPAKAAAAEAKAAAHPVKKRAQK